jgi:hypothetical protein
LLSSIYIYCGYGYVSFTFCDCYWGLTSFWTYFYFFSSSLIFSFFLIFYISSNLCISKLIETVFYIYPSDKNGT